MQSQQQIPVQPTPKRDNFATDDRAYLIDLRRGLLQLLSVVERKLGLNRNKCRRCGHVLSE